jgi:hypothetical protein
VEKYVMHGHQKDLATWFLAFEARRAAEEGVPEDQRDQELLSYKERTSHSTDAQDSLEWRQEVLLRKCFEQVSKNSQMRIVEIKKDTEEPRASL